MPNRSTAIALLAAGASRRFGRAKLDCECAGKSLGLWALEAAEAADFDERILIVRPDGPDFARRIEGWQVVVNASSDGGHHVSVRAAVDRARGVGRLVIALADMPLVAPSHLNALAHGEGIIFTSYRNGRRGVPAAFPDSAFDQLAELKGSASLADWAEDITHLTPPSTRMLLDVDTPEQLKKVEQVLRQLPTRPR